MFIRARTIDAIGLAMRKGGSDGRESLNIETFMHPPLCVLGIGVVRDTIGRKDYALKIEIEEKLKFQSKQKELKFLCPY